MNSNPQTILDVPVAPPRPLRKALVLSAGGMFGAYQAGVYRALHDFWKPDLVVGASVGALNAWSIAAGITPGHLIDLWCHPDAGASIQFLPKPSLHRGMFDPRPLLARASRMHSEFKPVMPVGLVAIEVPRCQPRIFRDNQITPEHLLATCSIPFFYPFVSLGGKHYTDGGLLESMPIWAAVEMGATTVIAVDSLPKLTPWPIDAAIRTVKLFRKKKLPPSLNLDVISPSGYLGTARDAITWNRDNIQRWIDMGIRDGEAYLQASPPGTKSPAHRKI